MTITQMPCNPGNYTARRSSAIRYLVVHYTGAPGTARNNGAYFASRGDIGASAHYFVDEYDVVQSVPDTARAWHCGAASYRHPECRNDNSLGVELCCDQDAAGRWRFDPATVANAVQLIRTLMAQYNIDADHVVRHYDVTGKVCPEPYVRDAAAWAEFKARLTAPETTEEEDMVRYNTVAEMPEYYRAEAQALIDAGALRGGTDGSLNISEDMLRCMIISKRYMDALLKGADTKPSGWAEDEMAEAVAAGITDGTRPRGYATREEAAIMVHRAVSGK
ncbi:MAG: peptidoglycan recognition family protein [Oscillospiraceae bacterium]